MKTSTAIPFVLFCLFLLLTSCSSDEGNKLAPAEERVEAARQELINALTGVDHGWKLRYRPTPFSGSFFMVLEFDDQGMVRIFSDVAENDGEFFDHSISYRIDNAQGLELILETYGVFHFLFEQRNASFEAEFEFEFTGTEGANLVFQSTSDFTTQPTILVFEPADANDRNEVSTEIAINLDKFQISTPQAQEQSPSPIQQIIFEEEGVSVFWRLNPFERTIRADFAAEGVTLEEVSNDTGTTLDLVTGYTLLNDRLVLDEPLTFVEGGTFYEVVSILFTEFEESGADGFCTQTGDQVPRYRGLIPQIGAVSMVSSLFDSKGREFQSNPTLPYSVNVFFLFDGQQQSLVSDGGLIDQYFPNATGFIFYYGFQDSEQPEYGAGLILDNQEGGSDFFARLYEPATTTDGNKITINMTQDFYHSAGASTSEMEAQWTEITDLLFSGSQLYALDFPVEGLQVFKLYNPCNGYEIFLVGG